MRYILIWPVALGLFLATIGILNEQLNVLYTGALLLIISLVVFAVHITLRILSEDYDLTNSDHP